MYNICKGSACALHLTPEYVEGRASLSRSENPYNFWDEYTKHYAWDIGNQEQLFIEPTWISLQIKKANEEISTWSDAKKLAMLRPDLD